MDNEIVIDVDADVRLSFCRNGNGVILITNFGNILVTPQEFLYYRCLFKITDIGNIGKLPVHCPSLLYLLRRTLLTVEQIDAILMMAIGAVSGTYKSSQQQENKELDNNEEEEEEETFLSLHQFLLCCKMIGQLQLTPDAPADHTLLVAMNVAYENELNSIGNNNGLLPSVPSSSSSSSSISVPLTSTSFANFTLGISPLTMPLRHRAWTSRVHVDDDDGTGTAVTEILRAKVCGWELSSEAFQTQFIRFKVITRVESVTSSVPTIRHPPQTSSIEQLYIQNARKLTTLSSTDSLSSAASSSSSSRTIGTGRTSPDHDNHHLCVSIPSHLIIEDGASATTLPTTTPALSVVSLGAHAKKKKKGKKIKAESEKEEKSVPISLPFLPPPRNAVAQPLLSPVVSEGPWPTSPSPVSTPTPSQQPMLVTTSSSPMLVQEATAYRRYKDFEALVILLRRLYKGTVIPPLPPKDWTTSFQQQTLPSEIFANQRLLELQCFVDALMAHPVLGKSYEVRAFFLASPPGLKAFKATLAHLQVDVDSGALLPVINSSQTSLLGQSLASWPTVLPGGAAGVRTLTAATGKAVHAATSSAVGLVSALWGLGTAAVDKTRESFAPTTTMAGSKEPMSCGSSSSSDDSFEEVERPSFPTPTWTTNQSISSPCTTNTNGVDITVIDPGDGITTTSNPTRGLTTLSVIKSKAPIGTTESNAKYGVLDGHPYGRAKNSNATGTGSNLFSTFVRNAREVASVGLMHVKIATASATSSSSQMPDLLRGRSSGESPGTCSDNGVSTIAKGSDSTPGASSSTPASPTATTASSLEASLFEMLRYLKIVHSLGETLHALTRTDGRRIFELSQLAHAMQV